LTFVVFGFLGLGRFSGFGGLDMRFCWSFCGFYFVAGRSGLARLKPMSQMRDMWNLNPPTQFGGSAQTWATRQGRGQEFGDERCGDLWRRGKRGRSFDCAAHDGAVGRSAQDDGCGGWGVFRREGAVERAFPQRLKPRCKMQASTARVKPVPLTRRNGLAAASVVGQ